MLQQLLLLHTTTFFQVVEEPKSKLSFISVYHSVYMRAIIIFQTKRSNERVEKEPLQIYVRQLDMRMRMRERERERKIFTSDCTVAAETPTATNQQSASPINVER